ncbi:hypothetical protein CBL_10650 [Carabus blaptoides fortunei]
MGKIWGKDDKKLQRKPETILWNTKTTKKDKIEKEIVEALRKIKVGKAPGNDNITPEMIKYTDEEGLNQLTEILNDIGRDIQIPEDWKVGTTENREKLKGNQEAIGRRNADGFMNATATLAKKSKIEEDKDNRW